nr:PREDICTED: protein asteroid [Megachile rotundata]
MGVSGLTKFINNRSCRLLQYYELHDTYLIIDGYSICCQIYKLYAKCNCAFGGDYDKYYQSVSDFFDDLLKCNVTPLVILDGAYESKKMNTKIRRVQERINAAATFCPQSQQSMTFFPLFLTEVFISVLKQKNIRHIQCLFEADSTIASIARILNCPVLSYDSDFYIYGTLYIPFNTLDSYVTKNTNGKGYVKCCKIYKTEYLLKCFKGLTEPVLPLAAILLGNDYVKFGTFKNFFCHIKVRGTSKNKQNLQQRRIEETFIWLSRYTLDNAIAGILSKLAKSIRQHILNIIETNINTYTNGSAEMLLPLGFSKDYVTQINMRNVNKIYKFNGDINNLTFIEDTFDTNEIYISEEEEEEEEESKIMNVVNESEPTPTNALISNLPTWFVSEYLMAKQPPYFLDLINQRLYICAVQLEDYNYPPSITVSLKILGVIFGLLKSAVKKKTQYMTYITRNSKGRIERYELQCTDTIFNCKIPSLFDLRKVPLGIRREIFNHTLEVSNMDPINNFPLKWKLYIICIKYWVKQQEPSRLINSCIYSIIVSMLFHIIDSKIGRYRSLYNFQHKCGQKLKEIQEKRKADDYKPNYSMDVTIDEAFNEIDTEDCILAAQFFTSHFEMDQKLYANPKKFNKLIVHAFAEFQNCLKHGIELNALLGRPYSHIEIANFYNGTLLYNLCNNFQTRDDVERYINTVLEKSSSVLRFLNVFLLKIKLLFSIVQEGIKFRKKHKKRKCSKPKTTDNDDLEYFSAEENLDEPNFIDPNNPFSALNLT